MGIWKRGVGGWDALVNSGGILRCPGKFFPKCKKGIGITLKGETEKLKVTGI